MRVMKPVVAALAAALATAGALVPVATADTRPLTDVLTIALAVTTYALLALAIELARPGHPVGRLMLGGALSWGLGEAMLAIGVAGHDGSPGSTAYILLGVLGSALRGLGWLVLILALPLVFPDGRVPGRGAVRLVAGCVLGFTLASLLAPVPLEARLDDVDNPLGLPAAWQPAADLLAIGSVALSFVALVVAVRTLARRWSSGGEMLRQQIAVFLLAFALPLAVLPIVATPWAQPWMFALVTLPLPVVVAGAMFQRRLYDTQLAANRTLTYLALSGVLTAVYALVVGGAGVLLRDRDTTWLPWAAAGVVAVAFAPLRESLQRTVTRLTYGRWSMPADVLSDTGRRLADAADSKSLLESLTAELVDGLGLDYAEICDATGQRLVHAGTPSTATRTVPLAAYGSQVGALRWAGRPLRSGEAALLTDLGHQIGGAVHTTALVESLRTAQEQLVLGREQERRRLRHDLHDGLGPALAGLGLQLDTVHNLLRAGEPVEPRIEQLRAGLRETVAEVRRIVEGLRPPAIDDLGLFGALSELGRQLTDGRGVVLELDLPRCRPVLPAAVEVAAYRIAQEALTNVVRHSQASACAIAGDVVDGALLLRITDDGRGGAGRATGLGMTSMHGRALEIGGHVEVASPPGGTTVTVRLPVEPERGPAA